MRSIGGCLHFPVRLFIAQVTHYSASTLKKEGNIAQALIPEPAPGKGRLPSGRLQEGPAVQTVC
jgi:hypothetical protein